jgi:hypothetical protein
MRGAASRLVLFVSVLAHWREGFSEYLVIIGVLQHECSQVRRSCRKHRARRLFKGQRQFCRPNAAFDPIVAKEVHAGSVLFQRQSPESVTWQCRIGNCGNLSRSGVPKSIKTQLPRLTSRATDDRVLPPSSKLSTFTSLAYAASAAWNTMMPGLSSSFDDVPQASESHLRLHVLLES